MWYNSSDWKTAVGETKNVKFKMWQTPMKVIFWVLTD